MSIKTELTNDEFIRLYGEGQWVRDFSRDGQEAVLDHIESMQDNSDSDYDLDWTGYFMAASEYTASDMIADNNGFGIDDHADGLIDIANSITFDDGIEKELENDLDLSNDDLWKYLKSTLLANSEFVQEAADLLARHHGLTELDNGHWIQFS